MEESGGCVAFSSTKTDDKELESLSYTNTDTRVRRKRSIAFVDAVIRSRQIESNGRTCLLPPVRWRGREEVETRNTK